MYVCYTLIPNPTRPRSHHAHGDLKLVQIVVRSRYERLENFNFRCFHDDTMSSLRFDYDPAAIIPRSHHACSMIIMILLHSSCSHYDHTTSYSIATRSYHVSTAIIARSFTIILHSYRLLRSSNNVNIVFHINTVSFLLFLINT